MIVPTISQFINENGTTFIKMHWQNNLLECVTVTFPAGSNSASWTHNLHDTYYNENVIDFDLSEGMTKDCLEKIRLLEK